MNFRKSVSCQLSGVLCFFTLFSCATNPGKTTEQARETTAYTADPGMAVSIAVPPRKNISYFSLVNSDAVAAVENGSPESLRAAVNKLRKNTAEYTESEKVLIGVAAAIMQIVWPSESFSWDVPSVSDSNPYLGAIASARQGVYDSSTGNTDFLTMVLPSLVLLTSETRSDYYQDAQNALSEALKQNPDSVLANYLMGKLALRQKLYTQARASLSRACDGAPDCFETAYALAECNYKDGKIQQSYDQAVKLLASHDQSRLLLKLCAETAFAAGDLTNAEQYVGRVLQQEPENAYYVLFRARILILKGDYVRASSLLDVYARTDTVSREYLVLRAQLQKDWSRNTTGAVATIEMALKLYPDDMSIVLAAAKIAAGTGLSVAGKTAENLAEQILTHDPKNPDALSIQISELVRAKNWTAAYRASSGLIALKTVSQDALYTHISICLSSGKKDEAWRLVSQLYEEKPSDEAVVQQYVAVLVAMGRSAEASRLIAQLLPSVSVRTKSFFYYERSFLVTGEDNILAELRSSLTANPRNQDALYRLYSIYYDKKEYRKAQYYLKQVIALNPSDEMYLSRNRELEQLLQ
jgi:uncharacterized protein HemY